MSVEPLPIGTGLFGEGTGGAVASELTKVPGGVRHLGRARHWSMLEPLLSGVDACPVPCSIADLTGRYLFVNEPYCALLGRDLEQVLMLSVSDVTHPEDAERDGHARRALARGQLRRHQIRKRYLRPEGAAVEGWAHVGPIRDGDARPLALIAFVIEVPGAPRHPEGSLAEEPGFQLLFKASPLPMWIYDPETLRILEVNEAACTHYGYTREAFRERTMVDLCAPGEPRGPAHVGPPRHGPSKSWVLRHRRADGRLLEVELVDHEIGFDGRAAVLVTVEDVTELNDLERQLAHQVLHDPLTGLPNRALFLDQVAQTLAGANAIDVLDVDLDGFHLVNDGLGHEAGDAILTALGERLAARLPAAVSLARITGDDFAVCVGGLGDRSAALALAREIQAVVAEPLVAPDGTELSLSACVGVATTTEPTTSPASLLRDAAAAAARAKQAGPGEIAFLGGVERGSALRRLGVRHELRKAIETGQISVQYQPIVSLADGAVVGAEALSRWEHPDRGLISPEEFIPLAEETGLIVALGRIVLEQACREAARWTARKGSPDAPVVSVNVSAGQLRDGELPVLVHQVLAATNLEPARLVLEVTETLLLDHGRVVLAELLALKELGVHLSLDDFGTGYSSLTYLDRLPFDVVKVDRSFVTGMNDDPRHRAIVAAVISLANTLKLDVIAEGVENAAEAVDLARLGAGFAQGYHFFPPLPDEELRKLLVEPRRTVVHDSTMTKRGEER